MIRAIISLFFVALVAAAPEPKPDPQLLVSAPITQSRTDTTVTQQHSAPVIGWNGAILSAPSAATTTHTTQITGRAPVVAAAPLVAAAPAVVASPYWGASPYYASAYTYPYASSYVASPYVASYSSPIVSSAHYSAPLVSSVYGYPAYSPYYSNYMLLKKKK